jgi:hypothetical protein
MSKAESADLIMKLYELRREEKMRDARNWMAGFFPESAEDIMNAMIDPASSAYFRMVTSYWDMAASFVNHGAIDVDMFRDTSGEHMIVFAKVEPHLADFRAAMGNPNYLKNLETLVSQLPDYKELLQARREMMKRFVEAHKQAEAAKAAI